MEQAIALAVPEAFVEAVARRAAELVAERMASAAEGRWLRGADAIARYVDAPRSRVYALQSAGRTPVHNDDSALIARTDELDAWVRAGGGAPVMTSWPSVDAGADEPRDAGVSAGTAAPEVKRPARDPLAGPAARPDRTSRRRQAAAGQIVNEARTYARFSENEPRAGVATG